jgi:hypothetical protein
MAYFFQKAPKLRLESDLNKPGALIDLTCRDALQDVLHMLKRCPSGEQLRVDFNAAYERYLKSQDAHKALACAFMESKQSKAFSSVLQDVKTSYELCYPYMRLTVFFLVGAAVSAYVGTYVLSVVAMIAVCLALSHVCGYEIARVARETQPTLLDEKLVQIEAALKKTFTFEGAGDAMDTGLLLADDDSGAGCEI